MKNKKVSRTNLRSKRSIQSLFVKRRREKWETQTKESYALLGEFTAEFQMLCYQFEQSILLMAGNFNSQKIMQSFLAGMTADPLISTYRSIISDSFSLTEIEKNRLSNIVKDAIALNVKRNKFLHGTWFIGWASADETDFSVARGYKRRTTKDGVNQEELIISEKEFRPLIEECKEVAESIKNFTLSLIIKPYR